MKIVKLIKIRGKWQQQFEENKSDTMRTPETNGKQTTKLFTSKYSVKGV